MSGRRTEETGQTLSGRHLHRGECPQCGRHNPTQNRFCAGCGTELIEPCLACASINGILDEFCGKCGADLEALLNQHLEKFLRVTQEAESLRLSGRIAQAIFALESVEDFGHPRLKPTATSAKELLVTLAEEQETLKRERADVIDQARQLLESGDFERLCRLQDEVPARLWSPETELVIEDGRRRQEALEFLQIEIDGAFAEKIFDDLARLLDRFQELRPLDGHTSSYADGLRLWKKALEQARDFMAQFRYRSAAESLEKLPDELWDCTVHEILFTAREAANQEARLFAECGLDREQSAILAIFDGQEPRLKSLLREYLVLRPHDRKATQLFRWLEDSTGRSVRLALKRLRPMLVTGVTLWALAAAFLVVVLWLTSRDSDPHSVSVDELIARLSGADSITLERVVQGGIL